MFLEQQFPKSAREWNSFYRLQGEALFVKVYNGVNAESDYLSEREHLLHWQEAQIKVPRIVAGVSFDFSFTPSSVQCIFHSES